MRIKLNRFFWAVFFLCLLPALGGSFWVTHAWGNEEYAAEFSVSSEALSVDELVSETDDLAPETATDDDYVPEAPENADHPVTDVADDDAYDFDQDDEWYGAHSNNVPTLADPIEPFNRAMYHFNDKMYFWVLRPVAIGYNAVVPEMVRVGIKNFFTNLAFPIRFTSSLLQADFKGALQEVGRFTVNTICGFVGFLDPASASGDLFPKNEADLGETFGIWGIGQGIYIVWPVIGPSSLRDTFATVGEYFLYPLSYLHPWYAPTGLRSFQIINDTSLRLGDYEALIGAAIDPYLSVRDVYTQYGAKKIENKRKKLTSPEPERPREQ